jgi:putative lipoprotein
MKRFLPVLLAALLTSPAVAQGITITRPGAAPATTFAPSLSEVPAGWRMLSGRVRAPRDVRLPAGSTVSVSIEDVTRMDVPSTTLLNISFPATRLSAPYQMQFNPVRLSPRRVYAVTARVTGPNGRLLYLTTTVQELPQARNAVMDVRVMPVR